MPVVALPDVTGALVSRLRSFSEITALVSTTDGWADGRTTPRVSNRYQAKWVMPTYAIRVQEAGGYGEDADVQRQRPRFDVHFYGPNIFEAARLWRITHPCLCAGHGTARQFVAASTRVYSVDQEGGITRLEPPSTAWPEVVAHYIVDYSEIPG